MRAPNERSPRRTSAQELSRGESACVGVLRLMPCGHQRSRVGMRFERTIAVRLGIPPTVNGRQSTDRIRARSVRDAVDRRPETVDSRAPAGGGRSKRGALEEDGGAIEVREDGGPGSHQLGCSLRRAGVGAGLRGPKCRTTSRRWWIASCVLPPTVPCYVHQCLPSATTVSTQNEEVANGSPRSGRFPPQNAKERLSSRAKPFSLCLCRCLGAFLEQGVELCRIDLDPGSHRR